MGYDQAPQGGYGHAHAARARGHIPRRRAYSAPMILKSSVSSSRAGSRRPMPERMSADMKCRQSSTVAVAVVSLGLPRLESLALILLRGEATCCRADQVLALAGRDCH